MTVAPVAPTGTTAETAALAASRPSHLAVVPDPRLRREMLAIRRARELTELLEARPDLHGSYAPADFAATGLLWTL